MQVQAVLSLLMLSSAICAADEQPSILGRVIHAHDQVHEMNRTALLQELSEHQTARPLPTDSDDVLRMRLFQARATLLERRNRHVMHAEMVLQHRWSQ